MSYLNDKIIDLLKEHKEGGEKFFDALDLMIRSDYSIIEMFLGFVTRDIKSNLLGKKQGVILSGKFGFVLYNNYKSLLEELFEEIIITNGGIRNGKKAYLGVSYLRNKEYVFLDDSFYSGTTKAGIESAIKEIKSDAKICKTYVIYDGSKTQDKNVMSLFRYYGQACTIDDLA